MGRGAWPGPCSRRGHCHAPNDCGARRMHGFGAQRPMLRSVSRPTEQCYGARRRPFLRIQHMVDQMYLFGRAHGPDQAGTIEQMGRPRLCRRIALHRTAASARHMLPQVPHTVPSMSRKWQESGKLLTDMEGPAAFQRAQCVCMIGRLLGRLKGVSPAALRPCCQMPLPVDGLCRS